MGFPRVIPLIATAILVTGCGRTPVASVDPAAEPARNAAPTWRKPSQVPSHRVVLPAGTTLRVRLSETIATDSYRAGDEFVGVVVDSVQMDGRTVVPGGAEVRGFVQKAVSSGRITDRAVLALGLRSLEINDTRVELDTDSVTRVSSATQPHEERVLASGGSIGPARSAIEVDLRIPAETVLAFRLREPVTL